MKKEFLSAFQLSRKAMFEVSYYTLSTNSNPDFTTCAETFNQPKTDWNMCGQCQKEVLKNFPTARKFYEKWDAKHLKDLTDEEYAEMREDLKALENRYNHIIRELDESKKPYSPHISFYDMKDLSMMKVK